MGVSKVTSMDTLPEAVKTALQYDSKCLIEKGIQGREIECAVLGLGKAIRASLPGEIVCSKKVGWYSYEAKYLMKDGAERLSPPRRSMRRRHARFRTLRSKYSAFSSVREWRVSISSWRTEPGVWSSTR